MFEDTAAAGKLVNKLIPEKTGKTYVEIFEPNSSSHSASNFLYFFDSPEIKFDLCRYSDW